MREGRVALYRAVDAGCDPLAVAIVAWECSGVARQEHPALTARRREHLLRYCAIADRLDGPGAGARELLDIIFEHGHYNGPRVVCSLDYFVCELRRWVRATRRTRRGRPPLPHERSGWYLEREERRERREHFKRQQDPLPGILAEHRALGQQLGRRGGHGR